jgi:hypothetical protein
MNNGAPTRRGGAPASLYCKLPRARVESNWGDRCRSKFPQLLQLYIFGFGG